MDDIKMRECGLERLSGKDLQIIGGSYWGIIKKLLQIGTYVAKFIDDYGKDIERGFNRGWEKY
ncbi:MAG: hypothetical protein RSC28_03570 [Bacteroidales bacterium]